MSGVWWQRAWNRVLRWLRGNPKVGDTIVVHGERRRIVAVNLREGLVAVHRPFSWGETIARIP